MKADIIPLTQDLTIIEASGSELKILGTAILFLESEMLGSDRKELEVAVIEGVEGNKEILVSLKLMKTWKMVHETFTRETVENYIIRINEENKIDSNYMSYYSVETDTSHSLPPPSKKCETLRKKILSNWGGVFKNTLEKEDRVNIPQVKIISGQEACQSIVHGPSTHPTIFVMRMTVS